MIKIVMIIAVFIAYVLGVGFIYTRYLSRQVSNVFLIWEWEFLLHPTIILMGAALLTYGTIALRTKRLHKSVLIFGYTLYFIMLGYLLFFKSVGIQGISLNPLSFIFDLASHEFFVPIMNIVFFIPLGLLCRRKSIWYAVMIGLCFTEIAQYVFSLGFFDLGDIAANFIGVAIGRWLMLLCGNKFQMV